MITIGGSCTNIHFFWEFLLGFFAQDVIKTFQQGLIKSGQVMTPRSCLQAYNIWHLNIMMCCRSRQQSQKVRMLRLIDQNFYSCVLFSLIVFYFLQLTDNFTFSQAAKCQCPYLFIL